MSTDAETDNVTDATRPSAATDGPLTKDDLLARQMSDDDAPTVADGKPSDDVVIMLRRNVTASSRDLGGKRTLVLHNEESGKFYHLGPEESVVVSLLDGSIPMSRVMPALKLLCIEWNDEELKAFLSILLKAGLLAVVDKQGNEQNVAPVAPSQPPPALHRATRTLSSLLSQKIPLGNADVLASKLLPYLGFAYTRFGFAVWLMLIVMAFSIAMDHWATITAQCKLLFAPESWISIMLTGVIIKVVHELGHAIAAKRKGVRVGSTGITLFLFAPVAYIDLTNSWKLRPRWARIQIAMGGVYLESWLAIFAIVLFAWCKDEYVRYLLTQVILIAGPATWITNANPLLRLDGYYALSDAMDIPNLRMHGRGRLLAWVDRLLLGKPLTDSHLTGWRRQFALGHAMLSVFFQAIWMTGMVVAVWHWTNALGVILAAVAVLCWVMMPFCGWWYKHWSQSVSDIVRGAKTRRRMAMLATILVLMVPAILCARNPFAQGLPVVVQYRNEQVGRALSSGFVTGVFVRSNQLVRKGDLLMEITDDELVLKRDQMRDELNVNLAKYRQLQNIGKLADAVAAQETAKQLQTSIEELDASINSLLLVAARDGVVVSEHPERWLGRFAKAGDVLVRIADPNDKELLVAIEETELNAYQAAVVAGEKLVARIRGGLRLHVEPTVAHPRFSTMLPHPALATIVGGDIPVTPDSGETDGYTAASPVGTALAALSPRESLAVRAGQRGTLYLPDDQIMYARLKQWVLGQPH